MEAIGSIFTAAPAPFVSAPAAATSFIPGIGSAATAASSASSGGFGGALGGIDFGKLFSGLGQAFGQYQTARDQAALIEYNAAIQEQRARDEQVMSSVEAARQRKRNRQLISNQGALLRQAGAYGTPLDVALPANADELELDVLTTKYNADRRAQGLLDQAAISRFEAGQVKKAGRSALMGGVFTGGGRLFSGIRSSFDPLNISVGF